MLLLWLSLCGRRSASRTHPRGFKLVLVQTRGFVTPVENSANPLVDVLIPGFTTEFIKTLALQLIKVVANWQPLV